MAEHGAIIKHNQEKAPKTGAWRYMHPEVDKSKCVGCGTCEGFCPDAVITVESIKYKVEGEKEIEKKIASIDYEYCKGCGVCAQVCPMKAIIMKKK